MKVFSPRAGRRPLARIITLVTAVTATAVLGACGDETTAPARALHVTPQTGAAAASPEQFETKVDLAILDRRIGFNPATGYAVVRVGATCSTGDTFDVIVEVRQDQKNGTVSGTTTAPGFFCTTAPGQINFSIAPQGGTFVSGTATVTARIANYQDWVIPTEARRRVRVSAY